MMHNPKTKTAMAAMALRGGRALAAAGGFAWLAAASALPAADVEEVRFGEGGAHDGQVRIERSESTGELIFTDALAGSATLSDLLDAATSHGALSGLDADDHPHYLTEARHDAIHADAAFNDALAIGPDIAGNATLGAHAGDSSIHLRRAMPETIAGDWTFSGTPEFAGGGIDFSAGGSPGAAALRFEATSAGDAHIEFDDAEDRFASNRRWLFGAGAAAELIEDAPAGERSAAALYAEAVFDSSEADEVRLRGASATAAFAVGGTGSATSDNLAVGVYGRAELTISDFVSADPLLVGVAGVANAEEEVRQVGVAALAPDSFDGTSRIGLVAGVREADLLGASLPLGGWAAYLDGNTRADGDVLAERFAIHDGGSVQARWLAGSGSPEGAVAAPVGSLFSRVDGGAGSTLYVKESGGSGNTGWAAK